MGADRRGRLSVYRLFLGRRFAHEKKDMVLRCWSGAVKRQRNWGKRTCGSLRRQKRPFLSDPGFIKAGFGRRIPRRLFKLLYLPFDGNAISQDSVKASKEGLLHSRGVMVYYTDHCPWTAKYIPFLEKIAGERGASVCFQKIGSKEEAQEAPLSVSNLFSLL